MKAGGGEKGFVHKQLEILGNSLRYLAGKAGAALPRIIGTIVNFSPRTATKVVEFCELVVCTLLLLALQPLP